jgi:hypothetical protein
MGNSPRRNLWQHEVTTSSPEARNPRCPEIIR